MHLSYHIAAIAFVSLVTGCASLGTTKAESEDRIGLSPRNLSAGECGLFVWEANQAKTFILYADKVSVAYYNEGAELALTRVLNANDSTELEFVGPNGQNISLSLLDAQSFQKSTRYRSGRLASRDSSGWDIVTPVVGLYSCNT